MQSFETARDVIDHVETFHQDMGDYYQQLESSISQPRVKMLLQFLVQHEAKLKQGLIDYTEVAPLKVLNTWFQFTSEETAADIIASVDNLDQINIENVSALGMAADDYLQNLFEEVTEVAESRDVKEVFASLQQMEIQEKHNLTRAVNSLHDM